MVQFSYFHLVGYFFFWKTGCHGTCNPVRGRKRATSPDEGGQPDRAAAGLGARAVTDPKALAEPLYGTGGRN